MKLLIIFICFSFIHDDAFSQSDSAKHLREINVTSQRLQSFSSDNKTENYDSVLTENSDRSLSELLQENNSAYLKNYGPSGLSTISLRGGSSYHTSVLWNGIPLSNQMHGLADLELTKNIFVDELTIDYGGTSSLWGSGAVSGSILLNNNSAFNSGWSFNAAGGISDYSHSTQSGKISFGSEKLYSSVRYYHEGGKNDYNYYNTISNKELKSENSGIREAGLMADMYFISGPKDIFTARCWFTGSRREIPSGIAVTNSEAVQTDSSFRYSLEWKHTSKDVETFIRSAYVIDEINYDDDFIIHPSLSTCKTVYNQLSGKYIKSNHLLEFGVDHSYTSVHTSDYIQKVNLNRIAPFINYEYHSQNQKLWLHVSARKEISSLNNSGIIYSGGPSYFITPKTKIRVSAATVYRNPTLNDLYWSPGGNSKLKPEKGFTTEAGINTIITRQTSSAENKLSADACVYYKNIDDWIAWFPSGSFYWNAQNILQVKSKGAELALNYSTGRNKFPFTISFNYFRTISTNRKTVFANDASFGKQLIYVPRDKFMVNASIAHRGLKLNINYAYTGIRYTTSDNSTFLQDYSLINIRLDKRFIFRKYQIIIFARFNNISNTDYKTVINRPMPLRNFETGISLTYKQK